MGCMALLLDLQEKENTGEGKVLANSKIQSNGRISAQVVFKKERSDNTLLKISAKLKIMGLKKDSLWLENHLVISKSRDFKITRDEKEKKSSKGKKRENLTTKGMKSGSKRVKGSKFCQDDSDMIDDPYLEQRELVPPLQDTDSEEGDNDDESLTDDSTENDSESEDE